MVAPPNTGGDWLQPMVEQSGLRRLLETVRNRLWLVLAICAVVTGIAVAYVLTAEKVYEAEANLLVQPIPAEDTLLSGLGLIRESSDPTLAVQTASQLITTTEVAEEVQNQLGTDRSTQSLLEDVTAEPVGQSNIVAVVAEGSSPEEAADLANAFSEAVVTVRTRDLHDRIDEALPALQSSLDDLTQQGVSTETTLAQQVFEFKSLKENDDPTIQFQTPATPPSSAKWPRPLLTILGGALLGLGLGVTIAFLLRALDPRLRREEQLREIYRLPILARVPRESRADRRKPLQPDRVSAPTVEAYRTLRATLTAPRSEGEPPPRSFLVTSPSPSEGKTSTAVNLATAIAKAGHSVILIEADLRRPSVHNVFGFSPPNGVETVLRGEVTMEDALVSAPGEPNLRLLMAGSRATDTAELFALPTGQRLITDAEAAADFVIVDSPPISTVVDALPLARRVDGVLLVVRIDKTHLRKIRELGELLASNGVTPYGFAILGARRPRGEDYYGYYLDDGRSGRRRRGRRAEDRTRPPAREREPAR